MNQIEIWLCILQRQMLSWGAHGMEEDLMQKIQIFIDTLGMKGNILLKREILQTNFTKKQILFMQIINEMEY